MNTNKKGYSVVASILMVGFLLIVTTGVFQLVLSELNDNRGRENYIRASAGAEWALELALLQIKENGYGYYNPINDVTNPLSVVLAENPLNTWSLTPNDVQISYTSDSRVNSYSGAINLLWFDIIPLFYLDDSIDPEQRVNSIVLEVQEGLNENLSWNIVSSDWGIAGQGEFSGVTEWFLRGIADTGGFTQGNIRIDDFLWDIDRENNYLILLNSSSTDPLKYVLKSEDTTEFFTRPRTELISSAQVGKYKQSFRTVLDNTEYLNLLKYSIFSN